MSKSQGNVVDPDTMVAKYGADACAPSRLRRAAREGSGVERIERAGPIPVPHARLPLRHAQRGERARGGAAKRVRADRKALRKLHQTLAKITQDFDNRWHFNTSIAALMELMNTLEEHEAGLTGPAAAEILEKLCLMLHPFAPFLSQEIWSVELGREGFLLRQPWPAVNEELAKEDGAEIPIQVNGKLRSKIVVPFGTPKDELERLVLADEKVKLNITGKQVVKIVIIPDKLVNVVVKG